VAARRASAGRRRRRWLLWLAHTHRCTRTRMTCAESCLRRPQRQQRETITADQAASQRPGIWRIWHGGGSKLASAQSRIVAAWRRRRRVRAARRKLLASARCGGHQRRLGSGIAGERAQPAASAWALARCASRALSAGITRARCSCNAHLHHCAAAITWHLFAAARTFAHLPSGALTACIEHIAVAAYIS
jgi:hypothetical protein